MVKLAPKKLQNLFQVVLNNKSIYLKTAPQKNNLRRSKIGEGGGGVYNRGQEFNYFLFMAFLHKWVAEKRRFFFSYGL